MSPTQAKEDKKINLRGEREGELIGREKQQTKHNMREIKIAREARRAVGTKNTAASGFR